MREIKFRAWDADNKAMEYCKSLEHASAAQVDEWVDVFCKDCDGTGYEAMT